MVVTIFYRQLHYTNKVRLTELLFSTYWSEVTFDSTDFDLNWGQGSVDLSDRLMLDNSGNPYIIPEHEFTGIPWHLQLDPMIM